MKVHELIELLQQSDPSAEVIAQRDPEGNGYSPLVGVWDGVFDNAEALAFEDQQEMDDYYDGHVRPGLRAVFLYPKY